MKKMLSQLKVERRGKAPRQFTTGGFIGFFVIATARNEAGGNPEKLLIYFLHIF
jgi:hypothetical protein